MSVYNPAEILHNICDKSGIVLTGFSPLAGGDINEVFLLEAGSETFVVKINETARFPGMFEAERSGLKELSKASAIHIPKVLKLGEAKSKYFLLLEHIKSVEKTPDFWEIFGKQLAALHRQTSASFGLETDNYIASLPQNNEVRDTAATFYIEMRLEPQIRMAREKGFQLSVPTSFYRNLEDLIPSEDPALIHGDLWNGNFLVNSRGLPCLIDPAVAYAPREMDLAMMKLFGGFHPKLFEAYHTTFPLQDGWEERLPLWQLYYLLVHLNLFGLSYKSQVTSIIGKFS